MHGNGETVGTGTDFYHDLDAALEAAWTLLISGADDRRSPMHTPVLATTRPDGAAEARTVVLRDVSRTANTIRFHTDRRSDKVAQLRSEPRCGLNGYDATAKMQLRLRGRAVLHFNDQVADAAWSGSRRSSRACYAQPVATASVLHDPQEASVGDDPDLDFARANFCAVQIALDEMEWVYLHHAGHRRALWRLEGDMWTGNWIAP